MNGTTLIDRGLIRISGQDAHGFLQGLVTNDVTGPLPAWAGLLTPQGKALFDFIIWSDGDDLLIDCEAAQADALIRRLTLYRLRKPITIAREDGLAGPPGVPGGGRPARVGPRRAAVASRRPTRPPRAGTTIDARSASPRASLISDRTNISGWNAMPIC